MASNTDGEDVRLLGSCDDNATPPPGSLTGSQETIASQVYTDNSTMEMAISECRLKSAGANSSLGVSNRLRTASHTLQTAVSSPQAGEGGRRKLLLTMADSLE